MPITVDPIDTTTVEVPESLNELLVRDRNTPAFNATLNDNKKALRGLRAQKWPVATTAVEPDEYNENDEELTPDTPGAVPVEPVGPSGD